MAEATVAAAAITGGKLVHSKVTDKVTNEDSIGIELVGAVNAKTGEYETVTKEQNESLAWLVTTLQSLLSVGAGDVFRHREVSYKQPSEAASASWR
jgi:hypothetical protein